MSLFSEKPLSNRAVCAEFGVSDYKRRQMIAAGILDPPIDFGGAYPQHSLSQVIRAQSRIKEISRPPQKANRNRKTKPLSKQLISEIRKSSRQTI